MSAKSKNLNNARRIKNDEFYTRFEDVEKELNHYEHHFKDKIVYCNCDTIKSAFWIYFHLNFARLGLKKLISTYYDGVTVSYKTEYIGGNDSDTECGMKTLLKGNGDFRSVIMIRAVSKERFLWKIFCTS